MTSHEYANRLKQIAEFLLSRPEFAYGVPHLYDFTGDKEKFLSAMRALGSVQKEYKEDYLRVTPVGFPEIVLEIPRNRVCRMVKPAQEAIYDCDPLLSQEEEASLEQKTA